MNIEQTILRLKELEPFIMPQVELFSDIKLHSEWTCMATVVFISEDTNELIQQLERRAEEAEDNCETATDRCHRLKEYVRQLRGMIRDFIPSLPLEMLDRYEQILKSNLIN